MNDERDPQRPPPDRFDARPLGDPGGEDGDIPAGAEPILEALSAPATPEELGEEDHYLRLFDLAGPNPGQHPPPKTTGKRKSLRTITIGGRAAAVVAASLVASVAVAAAYTGALPRGLQSTAHRYVGAQAPPANVASPSTLSGPRSTPTTSDAQSRTLATSPPAKVTTPVDPTPTDIDGASGRCTAWSKGGLSTTSTSYHRLVADAGGVEAIGTYCASLLQAPSNPPHTKKAPEPPKQPKKPHPATPKQKPHGAAKKTPPGQLKKGVV